MDITTKEYKGYSEFKSTLDREISNAAAGFVRIGYMLKVARDTNVLSESGYKSVAEFAQAEYGLSKDVVSRYIAINDRYSENGYSYELAEQYRAYGYAKLAEMLTLPAEVVEVLDDSLTKEEIRAIKTEIKEEQKITDLEVMMENPVPSEMSLSEMALRKYMEDDLDTFAACSEISDMVFNDKTVEAMLDALAPSGIAMHVVRIPGTGRLIMSIRGKDRPVETVNARTGEKDTRSWEELFGLMKGIFDVSAQWYMDQYCVIYGHEPAPKEEKQEVEPAQPKKEEKKPKVTVPKKPEPVKKEAPKPELKPVEDVHESEKHARNEENTEQQVEDVHQEPAGQQAEPEVLEGTVEDSGAPEQESKEPAVSEESDQAAGLLSEQEIRKIWCDIKMNAKEVYEVTQLFSINEVHAFGLAGFEEAYDTAINLAAGLEKLMMNERRRENGTSEERSSDKEA